MRVIDAGHGPSQPPDRDDVVLILAEVQRSAADSQKCGKRGGNTVLGYQPYDMRKDARCGGFCSSTWGATGGLTVRIAHIIHMDANTTHVDYCTRYVSYLPTSDVPTLASKRV